MLCCTEMLLILYWMQQCSREQSIWGMWHGDWRHCPVYLGCAHQVQRQLLIQCLPTPHLDQLRSRQSRHCSDVQISQVTFSCDNCNTIWWHQLTSVAFELQKDTGIFILRTDFLWNQCTSAIITCYPFQCLSHHPSIHVHHNIFDKSVKSGELWWVAVEHIVLKQFIKVRICFRKHSRHMSCRGLTQHFGIVLGGHFFLWFPLSRLRTDLSVSWIWGCCSIHLSHFKKTDWSTPLSHEIHLHMVIHCDWQIYQEYSTCECYYIINLPTITDIILLYTANLWYSIFSL